MSKTLYGPSIVNYETDESGHSCGYCHSNNTSYTNGMWAHTMTVEDYQDLIDRGWRRSGKYCYKPVMTTTCCPMYTIKCAARDFRVSKSQKKILKRFHKFLAYGITSKDVKPSLLKKTEVIHSLDIPEHKMEIQNKILLPTMIEDEMGEGDKKTVSQKAIEIVEKDKSKNENISSDSSKPDQQKVGKSRQMKAKYLRIERKKQKLRNMGLTESEIEKKLLEKKKSVTIKTLEDFLNEPQPENPAHKLEIKLVRSMPACSGLEETYEAYKKYQIHVHKDPPQKLSRMKFQRFLVVSPLEIRLVLVKSTEFERTFTESAELFAKYQKAVHNESEHECNAPVFNYFLVDSTLKPKDCYGSYHQQYWLDGKLIAVGVIDILPKCLSSVYFLYDPEYMWLSLGTYGALREVEFVRKLTSQYPDLKYYYMGYYIHSCVKMRYKAAFRPSYLLCPEAYTWHPIRSCLAKLDASKYSRLNDDLTAKDPNSAVSPSEISILHNQTVMSFASYLRKVRYDAEEREEILKYASLVGKVCAKRILLYRP